MDTVKGLLQIYTIYVDNPLPLITLLQYVAQSEYVLSCSSPSSESRLLVAKGLIYCFTIPIIITLQNILLVIIYMKKLLHSEWLKQSAALM